MIEGDFIDIIKSEKFRKIQLLIHPIWWNNEKTDSMEDYNCFIAKKTLQLKKEIANLIISKTLKLHEEIYAKNYNRKSITI